jgi:hypothetical protein
VLLGHLKLGHCYVTLGHLIHQDSSSITVIPDLGNSTEHNSQLTGHFRVQHIMGLLSAEVHSLLVGFHNPGEVSATMSQLSVNVHVIGKCPDYQGILISEVS